MRGRRPRDEFGPKLRLPKAPKELDEVARKEWKRLIGKLAGLDERDRALLATYCLAWSRILTATAELEKGGMVVESKNGIAMPSPWVSILNSSTRIVQQAAAKLGLSPFARGQIQTNKTLPKTSEWEGLLADHHEVTIAKVG